MTEFKFIHISDLHLGKKQYNIPERYEDYFRAFRWMLNKALEEQVDCIIIAGDMIDSEQHINPSMLRDLIISIQQFKIDCRATLQEDIPIICIEGNHENPFYTDHTWLKLLNDLSLIVLLTGDYDYKRSVLTFKGYSEKNRSGGKLQIKNAVIYGLSYFGSSTPELFPLLVKEIKKDENKFNILMMHFGITGFDKRKPGLELSGSLNDLHRCVDYLALGHYHKQYRLPDENPWIFNPGSLENNEISELEGDRGAFMVTIYENNQFMITPLTCSNGNAFDMNSIPNRKFFLLSAIDISEFTAFEEAQEGIMDKIKKMGISTRIDNELEKDNLDKPILYFTIEGKTNYSRLEVDLPELRRRIMQRFDILGLKIHNMIQSKMEDDVIVAGDLKIHELEKEIFLATLENEENFKDNKERIYELFSILKTELTESKPDYQNAKNALDKWFLSNYDKISAPLMTLISEQKIEKQRAESTKKRVKNERTKDVKKPAKAEKIQEETVDNNVISELLDEIVKDKLGFQNTGEQKSDQVATEETEEEFEPEDIIDDGEIEF